MTDLRKAAEMALQALCSANPIGHALEDHEYHNKATEALRQALAQLEQKPVAWIGFNDTGECREFVTKDMRKTNPNYPVDDMTPLYTAPPRKEWVCKNCGEQNVD